MDNKMIRIWEYDDAPDDFQVFDFGSDTTPELVIVTPKDMDTRIVKQILGRESYVRYDDDYEYTIYTTWVY